MRKYINRVERSTLRSVMKMYGMRAKPSEWTELQQDKNVFGKITKGINVARLSEEDYMDLVQSCKQTKLVM